MYLRKSMYKRALMYLSIPMYKRALMYNIEKE